MSFQRSAQTAFISVVTADKIIIEENGLFYSHTHITCTKPNTITPNKYQEKDLKTREFVYTISIQTQSTIHLFPHTTAVLNKATAVPMHHRMCITDCATEALLVDNTSVYEPCDGHRRPDGYSRPWHYLWLWVDTNIPTRKRTETTRRQEFVNFRWRFHFILSLNDGSVALRWHLTNTLCTLKKGIFINSKCLVHFNFNSICCLLF